MSNLLNGELLSKALKTKVDEIGGWENGVNIFFYADEKPEGASYTAGTLYKHEENICYYKYSYNINELSNILKRWVAEEGYSIVTIPTFQQEKEEHRCRGKIKEYTENAEFNHITIDSSEIEPKVVFELCTWLFLNKICNKV